MLWIVLHGLIHVPLAYYLEFTCFYIKVINIEVCTHINTFVVGGEVY